MADVRGVVCLEASVSGDVVSEGEIVSEAICGDPWESDSLRGEYGGGGEATGSKHFVSYVEGKRHVWKLPSGPTGRGANASILGLFGT